MHHPRFPIARACSAAALLMGALAAPAVHAQQTTAPARPTGPGEAASQPMDPRATPTQSTPAQKKPAQRGSQSGPAPAAAGGNAASVPGTGASAPAAEKKPAKPGAQGGRASS